MVDSKLFAVLVRSSQADSLTCIVFERFLHSGCSQASWPLVIAISSRDSS